jgi:hypothetical protein
MIQPPGDRPDGLRSTAVMPEFFDADTGMPPSSALLARYAARLPELAFEPGLAAAVDQHAAAIRDAVGGHSGLRHALGDYVLGFTDALREMGWTHHEGYDFAGLRLTAVCWLTREYRLGAPSPSQ